MAKHILICRQLFSVKTLVPGDEALIVLESQFASDRIRRLLYNRIQSITTWRKMPWSVLILGSLPAIGGGLLVGFLSSNEASLIIGGFLLAIGLIIITIGVIWRRSYLAVTRDGETRQFSAFISPRKRKRFLARLDENLRNYQKAHQPPSPAPGASGAPGAPAATDDSPIEVNNPEPPRTDQQQEMEN